MKSKLGTRGNTPDPEFDKLCAQLYKQNLSTYEVAELLQTSQGRVARALRRTKTPRRLGSPASHLRYGTVRK